MQVESAVTDEHQGDILGDLNHRRARITGIERRGTESGTLTEMFGYAGAIRSLSHGRASYFMLPTSYETVPASGLPRMLKAMINAPTRSPPRKSRAPFFDRREVKEWSSYVKRHALRCYAPIARFSRLAVMRCTRSSVPCGRE